MPNQNTISLAREKVLSPEEAQALLDQAHDEMMAAKKRMDMDRNSQEDELQRKLSERKRKRMEEQVGKFTSIFLFVYIHEIPDHAT